MAQQSAQEQAGKSETRNIRVLADAGCDPDSCRARRKDKIVWTSAESEFEIVFGGDSPVGGKRFTSKDRTLSRPVGAAVAQGRGYKYSVRLLPNGPEKDPEIFIFE